MCRDLAHADLQGEGSPEIGMTVKEETRFGGLEIGRCIAPKLQE